MNINIECDSLLIIVTDIIIDEDECGQYPSSYRLNITPAKDYKGSYYNDLPKGEDEFNAMLMDALRKEGLV